LKTVLENFQRTIEAIPLSRYPGTFPGIVKQLQNDGNQEHAAKKAERLLTLIKNKGKSKVFKKKEWFNTLKRLAEGQK